MRVVSCSGAGGLAAALVLLLAGCAEDNPQAALKLAYRLGVQAIDAHDFADAARYLGEASRLAPDDPFVALDLGVAYQNLGELDKARIAYRHAAETGEKVKTVRVTDPLYAGRSVADLARDNLASLPP